MADQENNKHSGVIAGAALIIAALGAMALITQHPTTGSPGHDSIAAEIVSESGLNSFVHGGMIAFVLMFYYGLSALSQRLGEKYSSVRAAQLLFAAATVAMIGAPLISGFIVPGVADHFVGANGSDEMFRALLLLLGESNQALAKAGSIFYGGAIFFWSLRLIALSGLSRIAGLFGLVVGAAIIAGILSGHLVLNVHGMGAVIFAMGAWFILVAVQLMRGKI